MCDFLMKVTIKWQDDNVVPSLQGLKIVTISLMTGSDLNPTKPATIGFIEATTKKLDWIVPKVDPPGQSK